MWTVFIFLSLWTSYCAATSSLPGPINVSFSSVNLRNTLHWSPGNGSPDGTLFTVQYAIYGDSVEASKRRRVNWRAVRQCTEIAWNWCDLSNETGDLEQGYHARVRAVNRRASSQWALTWRRFDPKLETTFGPPLVSLEMEDNNVFIMLKGPMRYQPNNHTPVVSMATLYPQMTYNLSILNRHHSWTHHLPMISSPYKYRLMEYNTEYCFSAKIMFLSMPIHCQSSVWHCITTPPDPLIVQLQRVVVGIIVPCVSVCLLAVAGYLLHHYLTGKGQHSPYVLNPPSFHPPPLTFNPENVSLIIFTVIKPSEPKSSIPEPAPSQPRQIIAGPPSSYAPQRCDAFPQPEEPWDNLSVDYGFVGTAETDAGGEKEERDRRLDGGEDGKNMNGEHQKCSARPHEAPASLETNGQRVVDAAGVNAPQAKSCLCQQSAHTCSQTHISTHAQMEMSTLLQAQKWSQANSVALPQTQAPSSFQGAAQGVRQDRNLPGLFRNTNTQTGLLQIPLNTHTKEGGMGGQMDEGIDGGVEEGGQNERVPLLSAYASQNITHTPTSFTEQSDALADDYAFLAAADKIEESDNEEEGEGPICIDWDPETGKLVLPKLSNEFSREGGSGDKERENLVGRQEGEEPYLMKGDLRLENVFVRQASEEEEEARREREGGGETVDILTKWSLVLGTHQ